MPQARGDAALPVNGDAGELLRRVSDMLPDGLVVLDEAAVIRFVNLRAGEILQVSVDALLDRPVREAMPLTDADGRDWWQLADPWQGLSTTKGHRERLLWTGDGVEVLVTARYLRRARGAPVTRVILSLRDALARKRVERDHAALISTIAHELRSPLTSVKGFSSTLLRRWDRFTDDQKRLIIETIEADADRVTRLIGDLLDVSRIDSGNLVLRRERMDLKVIVDRHQARLAQYGVPADRISIVECRPWDPVWADPDRLDQVLINLVENALKHGAGLVTVTVQGGTVDLASGAAGDARPAVIVSVADEGAGIPEQLRGVAFSRFWHGPGQGNSGLGLYVVKALVAAHGGRIAIGTAAGGGADVRFSLPCGEPESLRRDAEAAAGR
jgi:signal transduction histidine kinase